MTFIDNVQLTATRTGPLALVNVTSVSQSMATGVTSEPITVTLTDANGLQVNAPAGGKTLSLASSSSGGRFLDANNNVISSVTVPAGFNTATVFYRDSVAGAPTLTVSGSGLTAATQTQSVVAASAVRLAHQSGHNVVDGAGDILHLYGVNLGCWLTMEGYLCPLDTGVPGSGTLVSDQYTAIALLDSRFGVATEQSLFRTYQSTWVTDADLQNVKNAGMNVIRVPFWWANLYTTNFEWRPDAFEYLDWVVSEAAKYNLYVILDLHGAFGSQSFNIWSGTANLNRYWENSFYQSKTAELWTRVATHFKYNNNVLAYDLLNEPDGAPNSGPGKSANIQIAQNQLYQTVRAVDSGHMIIQELTGGSWDWNQLKSPATYGWTNVAYSPHSYPPYGATAAQAASEYNKQVNEFVQYSTGTASADKQENVPDIIGEMNWESMEQSWLSALGNFSHAGINWLFWSLKGTEGAGQDRWALYNENGFAWGDPEGEDTAGNYPNGSIADLYRPNLMQDSAQEIANEWGAFTTAGTASTPALPGTYPLTVTYPANFHKNYVIGDPLTDVLMPQTAVAEGLLPPAVPLANGVAGVNFGFENPFVSNEAGGGDAADFRSNYLYDPQAVSAGWTFTGQAGITSTGLQTGGITGWGIKYSEVLAPEGKQVAFIQGTSSGTNAFSQKLTSAQAGAWTVTFSAAQQTGSGQSVAVSLNGTALGTIKPGSTYGDYTVASTAPLAAGTYPLAFTGTATSGGILIDNVRITVGTPAARAPVVNSGGTVTAYTGTTFDYTISAANQPTSYSAAGLPAGLSVNPSTGLISGKPTATGTFTVTLGAANAAGTGTQGLTMVVAAPAPYLGYSASGTSTEGSAYSYRIGASGGTPTSYNAYGLPAGLTINSTTGYITGTPTVSGSFSVLLVASNATGTAEEVLKLDSQSHQAGDHQSDDGHGHARDRVQLRHRGQLSANEFQCDRVAARIIGRHGHGRDLRHANHARFVSRDPERWQRHRHGHRDAHADGEPQDRVFQRLGSQLLQRGPDGRPHDQRSHRDASGRRNLQSGEVPLQHRSRSCHDWVRSSGAANSGDDCRWPKPDADPPPVCLLGRCDGHGAKLRRSERLDHADKRERDHGWHRCNHRRSHHTRIGSGHRAAAVHPLERRQSVMEWRGAKRGSVANHGNKAGLDY